ncbi:exo-beta-N-acetylmuramidase NamZ family protein [Clostridium oryzae]|uniref:DUF1343 domain-containing protein n=1 Tax=Clostridium oryzae TaxID=1450648 RepID=A0A1V4IMQ6_9CLOT|nr:DUF1343 domain-containing protein [Clostridium oryzae]OPJ60777.1 hypothetical protein CLORY_26450 [Clostridium oryzae]
MSKVSLGIDNIEDYLDLFQHKKVGLITNNTGYNSDFKSTVDILKEKTYLTALYSPEHGIRGDVQAGEKVDSYIDEATGIIVYSLYGKNKKPSEEILNNVDVLALDIQDAGARFYTYLYTMAYAMESCREFNKKFVVFDRPNPINGKDVEGNLLKEKFRSFVGRYPIPQRYGLTIGETAKLFNEEFSIGCDLEVIPMKNWKRDMYFDETGLSWIMPSPNMPSVDTSIVYTGTCIFEGTNISEGRGTTKPFEIIGAPWLNANRIADIMNSMNLPGVKFTPAFFTPTFSKHNGELCRGIQLHVIDRYIYKPVKTGLFLYDTIRKASGDKFEFITFGEKKSSFGIDYLTGDDRVRKNSYKVEQLYSLWQNEVKRFISVKEKYHLY